MRRSITFATACAAALISSALPLGQTAVQAQLPETIDLPEGFAGEGVASAPGGMFYAGSRSDGLIAIGDLRAGTSDVFVDEDERLTDSATGLEADVRHGLLWVAGAGTGAGAVYDLETGEGVAKLTFTTDESFINDVVVTRDAAYFTNSMTPVIHRVPVSPRGEVGEPETIDLAPPAGTFVEGFNINGIEAVDNGSTLIVVNSATGLLYTVDARTGASAEIDLGGVTLPTADGILLVGDRLYVLQNGAQTGENQITVVRLRHQLTEGEVVDTITSELFETATTLARSGGTLMAVNAQFAGAPIDDRMEVVLLPLH